MITGVITGVAIMLVLFLCVFLGYRLGHKPIKAKEDEQDLEEQERLQKLQEGFSNIMQYDYSQALGKR